MFQTHRLGQRSIHLKRLCILHGPQTMKQRELWAKLPDACHHLQGLYLDSLVFTTAHQLPVTVRHHSQMLSKVVCRDDGAPPRLLQHPHCRLKELI